MKVKNLYRRLRLTLLLITMSGPVGAIENGVFQLGFQLSPDDSWHETIRITDLPASPSSITSFKVHVLRPDRKTGILKEKEVVAGKVKDGIFQFAIRPTGPTFMHFIAKDQKLADGSYGGNAAWATEDRPDGHHYKFTMIPEKTGSSAKLSHD